MSRNNVLDLHRLSSCLLTLSVEFDSIRLLVRCLGSLKVRSYQAIRLKMESSYKDDLIENANIEKH